MDQIQHIRKDQPGFLQNWEDEDRLWAPYLQFYYARKLLEDGRMELDPVAHRPQVNGLLDYLETNFGKDYSEADDLFQRGYFKEAHLHKLFELGGIVAIQEGGHDVALKVTQSPLPGSLPIILRGEHWDFDGAFHKVERSVTVHLPTDMEPDDEALISSLTVVPLVHDKTGMREKLERRGAYFWKCRHRRLVTSEAPRRGFDIQVTNPRYMIDMETYNALHGEENEARNQADTMHWRGDLRPEEMQADEPPTDDFTLLLPATIKAFRFHDKKWKTLSVEYLQDVVWDTDAFNKLVFNKEKKKLIKALVKNHVVNSASADIIESKGNGLEFSNRPLYRLNSGDIGTDPEMVEKSLEHIFYLGNTWKAVVLLDECEVFMEQRVASDLQRNALVSVFLRALEYYDGILLLTSNRVGTFDEAFKSRMHLAVYYPPLDKDDREVVWSNFFQRLADEKDQNDTLEIDIKGLKNSSSSLAQIDLNGRQIRNAVRTARQLALFDNETFSTDHIREYIKVVKEFETYVEETQGDSSSKLAELAGVRKDPNT
ncbi:hypothetical protein VSDG_04992 [Cytospora chrysosperma]|uniref:AAA+ ATPase lid domain-containing protein n=1 Tax=Cytospora chrysosperma TaxID=252740 RepID=A0A423VYQ4_CYTCH|nr:hypothetical protein VSDG_04992 [Valsa sordida]